MALINKQNIMTQIEMNAHEINLYWVQVSVIYFTIKLWEPLIPIQFLCNQED